MLRNPKRLASLVSTLSEMGQVLFYQEAVGKRKLSVNLKRVYIQMCEDKCLSQKITDFSLLFEGEDPFNDRFLSFISKKPTGN